MKIKRVQVTVRPEEYYDDWCELSLEVATQERIFTLNRHYAMDHFTSMFDVVMDELKRELLKSIKETKEK